MNPRLAARYNVRPLLVGSAEALRDAVVRLGVSMHDLTRVARHGVVEAFALQGLTPGELSILERVVREGDGDVFHSGGSDRAVLVMPLSTAGEVGARLADWGGDGTGVGQAIADVLVARAVPPAPLWVRGRELTFRSRTLVMGVVNVTPDSFSGDGFGPDARAAIAHGRELAASGADIIDVGGESTRPNSTPVSVDAELSRVLPVITELSVTLDLPISIDTRKAAVAEAAITAGAAIVNDVWGLHGDPEMAAVIAAHENVGVVAMHNQHGTDYGDLLEEVCASLRESVALAEAAGIAAERVIVDPGFGFGKTPAQNLELIRRLAELRGIGRPLMVGASRKSTIGILTGEQSAQSRLEGSLAFATLAVAAGAHLIRAHDVAATARALRVADAVVRGTPEQVMALPRPGPTG